MSCGAISMRKNIACSWHIGLSNAPTLRSIRHLQKKCRVFFEKTKCVLPFITSVFMEAKSGYTFSAFCRYVYSLQNIRTRLEILKTISNTPKLRNPFAFIFDFTSLRYYCTYLELKVERLEQKNTRSYSLVLFCNNRLRKLNKVRFWK